LKLILDHQLVAISYIFTHTFFLGSFRYGSVLFDAYESMMMIMINPCNF